jgi:predicted N-acetyltransferase YhbS
MVTIREEKLRDAVAREALLDEAYGSDRFTKTSARLREGRLPAAGLSLVAVHHGRLVGTVRLWHVTAGRGGRRSCSGRSPFTRSIAIAVSARR